MGRRALLALLLLVVACGSVDELNFGETTAGPSPVSTAPSDLPLPPSDPTVAAASRAYLDANSAAIDVFYLITDEVFLVDMGSDDAMKDQCTLISVRLDESVAVGTLVNVALRLPDPVLVELYLNSFAARASALDACVTSDTGRMLAELQEARRLDELITTRLSG